VGVVIEVDPKHLGLPDEAIMSCTDGLQENRYYVDSRGWDRQDFSRLAAAEDAILAYAAAGGDLQSDDAAERFKDDEAWATGIDPGLIATVIALAVVGCCPVTSCVGGPGHRLVQSLILCWCPVERWPWVRSVAVAARVSLEGVSEGVTSPCVLAYTGDADDWQPLREFGQQLVAAWDSRLAG